MRMLVALCLICCLPVAVRAGSENPDRDALVSGGTAFACDLYAKLSHEGGNIFVSPYSVSTALAMDGGRDLFLGLVIHKAFVEVTEEGTEAAAATGALLTLSCAPVPERPATFRADHPFLFLIRDVSDGTILFLGRILDPTR